MSFALCEPSNRADPSDLAAGLTEVTREIALRRQLAAAEMLSREQIDAAGITHCRDCDSPIECERLAALSPRDSLGKPVLTRSGAVRCISCQEEHEQQRFLSTGRKRP